MSPRALACALCLIAAACPAPPDDGPRACNDDLDCFNAQFCSNGFCTPRDDGAEGEGAAGEGEGAAGEGEGAAGEGEGEGGEGEGAAGEGEGEVAPASSCEALHAAQPALPSGVYAIDAGAGPVDVECDMTTAGGGWALLLRYDSGDPCPGEWIAGPDGGCVRVTDAVSTSALATPPYAFHEMRGVVHAFAFGGSDAFRDQAANPPDIELDYVDGMTITRGTPRTHVFTFADGVTDAFPSPSNDLAKCPCDGGSPPPLFVGTSYLCEEAAASIDPTDTTIRFYDTTDVLFDGQDIGDAPCVGAPESAPDFDVELGVVSDDVVELRLMDNEPSSNENTEIIHMDLWVR